MIFKEGFIPRPDQTPDDHTHAKAKLIYNILKVIVFFSPEKRKEAFKEIRAINDDLADRVETYYNRLMPEEIAFFKGPRPMYFDDGTLAIYDPIRDNPLLMRVYEGEIPRDVSLTLTPGVDLKIGPALRAIRNKGRIVVAGR